MCGRIYNIIPCTDGFEPFLGNWPDGGLQSYNIAPTQTVPIITQDGTVQARWGLIPSWSKEFESKYSTFNARIESVEEKPLFRNAWKDKRSCIVPVGGYYEWRLEEGSKQPYAITYKDRPMFLAGLWEPWDTKSSFTLLTQQSSGVIQGLHHRMPMTVETNEIQSWMEKRLLPVQPEKWAEGIKFYKVSKEVNNVKNNSSRLLHERSNL